MMNGLMTQLVRIAKGKDVEEAHMRNRQLIARWAYEHGQRDKVVEIVRREGKSYVVINDYRRLRGLFAQLLAEIQRIKSEGDFKGFVNPVMRLVKNAQGEVTDVTLDYTEGYAAQMLRYSRDYSYLNSYND